MKEWYGYNNTLAASALKKLTRDHLEIIKKKLMKQQKERLLKMKEEDEWVEKQEKQGELF